MIWPRFRWRGEGWGARSLRARITIAASTLFAIAVVTGTVVRINDQVVARSPLADLFVPMLDPAELARARDGHRITINGNRASTDGQLRVSGVSVGNQTVLVATSLSRVDQS